MGKNTPGFSCDMVISMYKEKLDWLKAYDKPENTFRNIYLYNKFEGNNDKTSTDLGAVLGGKEAIKIDLKNVGRCDHTYLYHIIQNWDNLADVTIFTKGSADLQREKEKMNFIIEKLFDKTDLSPRSSIFKVIKLPLSIPIQFATFKLNAYQSTHPSNRGDPITNTYSRKMGLASPRPFGKWYKQNFNDLPIYHVSLAGVMAVSRELIKQHDKEYYERFLKQLEEHENPEVGHYIERSWIALFDPVPPESMYVDGGYNIGGWRKLMRLGTSLGTRTRKHRRARNSRLKRRR